MCEIPKEHFFGAIVGPEQAEMHSELMPEKLGPTDVLVKMLICNICTTDFQTWQAKRSNYGGFPFAAGHEWVGEVVMIGENVKFINVGDHVGACGGGCGECINCRQGRTDECLKPKGKRPKINGYFGSRCFSNYKVFKQNQLIKMNKKIAPQLTAFLEPVSAAVGGMTKVGAKPGDTVAIIGAGSMGILNALVYHAVGCRVILTEVTDKKLERARSLGWAEVVDSRNEDAVKAVMDLTDGEGVDIVVPTVPVTSIYDQAHDMLKAHNGKILLFGAGYPAPEMHVDPNEVHYNRSEIVGTYGGTVSDIVLAAKLINNKVIDPSFAWEGAIYPLRDIQKAYVHAATPDMYRVSVDLQGI